MPERKFYRKTYQKTKTGRKRRIVLALKFLGLGVLFLAFAFLFLFIYYAKDFPRPEIFSERHLFQSTKIYDRSGKILLYEIYGEEKRTWVSLETIPERLKQAVIVAEDANFYHHFGVDFKGIVRAILADLKIGRPVYGGSTLPQQLIRSTFLSTEKTAERKTREIILALELDRRYPKDQILEWYLNQVPFGQNAYGVEAASQTYFKKPVSEVSLAEAAVLAALIRAPYYLSPYGEQKPELLARKDYILEKLAIKGYFSREEVERAKAEELEFSNIRQPIKAPHFVLYVKDELTEKYGENFLRERGLKVYTSLDWELQEWAEKVVFEGVATNKNFNAHNAALVAINPKNGEILAMVGSGDYFGDPYPEGCTPGKDCLFEPKVNIAAYGLGRQPGSAFKPFAYTVAFKKGLTPETKLWDTKTEFNPDCEPGATQEKDEYGLECYHPKNYDGKFRGLVSLREALAQSINVPSVKVLYLAGIKETIDLAKTLGISTLNKPLSWYGLSLVLGGGEVKLLDMVSAYGVFAAEGLRVPPVSIVKIEDSSGNIVEENKKTPKRVLEAQIARLINDILSDNEARAPLFGLNSPLYFKDYQVAVKTGTTQDYRDAWTIGYSPTIVAGVWAGNNDNTPVGEKPGVMLSAPIWNRFMGKALLKFPKEDFGEPEPISVEKPLGPHSILYYLDEKESATDPQYQNWEEAVKEWLASLDRH